MAKTAGSTPRRTIAVHHSDGQTAIGLRQDGEKLPLVAGAQPPQHVKSLHAMVGPGDARRQKLFNTPDDRRRHVTEDAAARKSAFDAHRNTVASDLH